MKKNYIESLSLPKGFPILEYENLAEIAKDGGTDERQTAVINNYLHQKDGLVLGRDNLTDYVEYVVKYPRSYEKVKSGDKEVEVPAKPHETDKKYLDAFVDAVVGKKFAFTGVTLSGNAEQDEAAVWQRLQDIVEKPQKVSITYRGTTTAQEVTLFDLKNDIKAPERKAGGSKIPDYAMNGAKSIIANGSTAKWKKTFTDKGIAFEPFDTKPVNGATKEEADAVVASNIQNLARAIVLNEAADRAKKYA